MTGIPTATVAELDEDYIDCMEDTLAIYEKPYNPAEPVVCLDEKPVSLHEEVRPPVAAGPGRIAKRDNEYKRCGTANVFCAVEPKLAGTSLGPPRIAPPRNSPEPWGV